MQGPFCVVAVQPYAQTTGARRYCNPGLSELLGLRFAHARPLATPCTATAGFSGPRFAGPKLLAPEGQYSCFPCISTLTNIHSAVRHTLVSLRVRSCRFHWLFSLSHGRSVSCSLATTMTSPRVSFAISDKDPRPPWQPICAAVRQLPLIVFASLFATIPVHWQSNIC